LAGRSLLISLGLLTLSKIFVEHFNLKGKKALIVYLIVLSAVLYNLVLINHVGWSKTYDNSNNLLIETYAREIKNENISDREVIAVNLIPGEAYSLNYLTNKSVVVFKSETVKNLLDNNKLEFAFNEFGIKYILGYSDKLTEDVVAQTEVINIATSSLEPVVPEMSRNKGWLMNVIK